MKNKSKLAIIAIITTLALTFTLACDPGGGDENGNGDPNGPSLGDTVTSTTTGMVLTWVPAGNFTMGQSDVLGATPHQVTLTRGFYIGKTEVTQKEYFDIMDGGPMATYQLAIGGGATNSGRGDNFPMYFVSRYDAILFCNRLSLADNLTPAYQVSGVTNWITATAPTTDGDENWDNAVIVAGSNGYRLPTEAEWEYACRAGTTTAYSTGSDITTDQANFNNALGRATTVGSYSPNAWGLYDMNGNVSEWCWDWYLAYPAGGAPRIDPIITAALGSGTVARGGGWLAPLWSMGSARRGVTGPNYRNNNLGFRVVRP